MNRHEALLRNSGVGVHIGTDVPFLPAHDEMGTSPSRPSIPLINGAGDSLRPLCRIWLRTNYSVIGGVKAAM